MALEDIDDLLLKSDKDAVWELFHENSKTSFVEPHPLYKRWPSNEFVVTWMRMLRRVKPYRDLPKIALPQQLPASRQSLDDVVRGRHGAHAFGPGPVRLEQLAKVLWMSYGVNRDNAGTSYPRPFRMIPSGGALYPLELYVHATRVEGLAPGLYHYDSEAHELDVLRQKDESEAVARCMVQADLGRSAAAVVFITAVFARSVFKYADRGYRFILLEAGHLAQNATLIGQEMGLATAPIGGYADRDVDRYLGIDGLNESTIYLFLLGHPGEEGEASEGAAARAGIPNLA
jgi:SagB-type dehydrogenase family enzyme